MKYMLCFFVPILFLIAWIDHKYRIIPNELNALILGMGILSAALFPQEIELWERLLGMCIISLPMLGINTFSSRGFGGGDIKLLAVCGFCLGWEKIVWGALIASFLAAIICTFLLILHQKSRKDTIAFGPYLCMGILISLFFIH